MANENASYSDVAMLDKQDKHTITRGFEILTDAIAANNYEKGWREPNTPMDQTRPMGDLIALFHSEVTEAFEAYRNGEPDLWYEHTIHTTIVDGAIESTSTRKSEAGEHFASKISLTNLAGETVLGKPQGIASELADVLIRVLDMAEEKRIPLLEALFAKHAYNQTRPYRHGGKAV